MLKAMKKAVLSLGLALVLTGHAAATDRLTLVLNWTPGADHAPLYWAQKLGLYSDAGIDLSIEIGKGSAFSAQRVGAGAAEIGIVDMPTAIQARGEGADLVAVMAIYANSPYTVYWKKSKGIQSIKDLAGRKIGTPPADAARQMWPAIARPAAWMRIRCNGSTWRPMRSSPPSSPTSSTPPPISTTSISWPNAC